jgi:hypothetical protein
MIMYLRTFLKFLIYRLGMSPKQKKSKNTQKKVGEKML